MRFSARLPLLRLLAASVLTAGVGASTAAQEFAAVSSDGFFESFDPTSPVSGIPLAGIRIGSDPGLLDVDNIKIATPPETGARICVVAQTRDGRYFSENAYQVPNTENLPSAMALKPATINYKEPLERYVADDYVVVGKATSDGGCGGPAAYLVPQVVASDSDRIFLQVNSGNRSVKATISGRQTTDSNNESLSCAPLASDGARIAFDTECWGDASALQGQKTRLVLELDDGFGAETFDYLLYLPEL